MLLSRGVPERRCYYLLRLAYSLENESTLVDKMTLKKQLIFTLFTA